MRATPGKLVVHGTKLQRKRGAAMARTDDVTRMVALVMQVAETTFAAFAKTDAKYIAAMKMLSASALDAAMSEES